MKKTAILFIGLFLLMALPLTACKAETVDLPAYPFSEKTLAEALEAYGFPEGTYIETETYDREGTVSITYTVRNPNNTVSSGFCFGILANLAGTDRSIGISVTTIDQDEALSEAECQKMLQLAAHLYGGFSSDLCVYEKFKKDCDLSEISDTYVWEKKVEGTQCQIVYYPAARRKMLINMATDLSVFAKQS